MAKEFYCTACGTVGHPRVRNRGSSAIEIILWLCFILPGLCYTLWRMGRKGYDEPKSNWSARKLLAAST